MTAAAAQKPGARQVRYRRGNHERITFDPGPLKLMMTTAFHAKVITAWDMVLDGARGESFWFEGPAGRQLAELRRSVDLLITRVPT